MSQDREAMEKFFKARFIRELRRSKEAGNSDGVYTPEMLLCLKDMAKNNVWPDADFSIMDSTVWSWFRD